MSAAAVASLSLSPITLFFISKHKITSQFSPISPFPSIHYTPLQTIHYANNSPVPSKLTTKSWKLYVISETTTNPVDISQEIVTTGETGVTNVIQSLLFIAFVGLSILTIGVIYIAVTDYLQKREGEKFEKEEAAKKKKSGKKGKVRVRARNGPRGFGQKVGNDDDFDDLE